MQLSKFDILISSIYFIIILSLFIFGYFTFKIFIITGVIYFIISFSISLIRGDRDYD